MYTSASLYLQLQDKYFQSVCELDIMFNLEKTHFILDEMVSSVHLDSVNTVAVAPFT
jgi:AP-4 complex subunit sigma-1